MKIILSEQQIQKLREDNPEFRIAPYATPEEFMAKDPAGYRRSRDLGTLDLYYPDSNKPQFKRGRKKSIIPTEKPHKKEKLSMMNVVNSPETKIRKTNKNKRWTPEALEQEARKYQSRGEFLKNNAPAYVISLRIPGFMEKMYGPKKAGGDKRWAKKTVPTNAGDIKLGSWITTHTEDFKVVSLAKNKIIGQSFCNPDKKIEINPKDIVDINASGRDKLNDLKMDFSKFYQDAGLTEIKTTQRNNLYKGGSNLILFLDDSRNPFRSKEDWIEKYSQLGTDDIHVKHIQTYNEFVHHITNYGMPKQIIFDHDLGKTDKEGGSGCSAAAWLVKFCITNKRKLPLWSISSANKYGRCCIGNVLRKFEELTNTKSET